MVRRTATPFMPMLATLFVFAMVNVLLLLTALQLLDRLLLSAGVALVVAAVSSRVLHRGRRRIISPDKARMSDDDSA